jgi:hypothetical protein
VPTPFGVTSAQPAGERPRRALEPAGISPLSGQPLSSGSGVQRLEDAQIPVELVSRCTVSDRPPGADPERTRADAIDDAIRVAKEIDQVLDQIGIVELNRCHLPQRAPELPQRVAISLWSDSAASQERVS